MQLSYLNNFCDEKEKQNASKLFAVLPSIEERFWAGALEKCVTENNDAFQTVCQQSAVKQTFTHIVKLMIKTSFALRLCFIQCF